MLENLRNFFSERKETIKSAVSTISILLIAPVVALLLTAFIFQPYEVDGPSMESTLYNKDRLIVLKSARTWARITGSTYLPKRGEIVVFNRQGVTENSGQTRQIIKRVIGLPGDRVVVKDGVITIYNKANPDGFLPDKNPEYGSVIPVTAGNLDITVPPNELFVCGDNRGNSYDSRSFGTIPAKDVVGKLVFRLFPLSQMQRF